MREVNKQFELLEFVFDSAYIEMMRFLSLLLLGLCGCVVSVVMWSSLVCRRTLYECGGCCDACIIVCFACVCAEGVCGCEGDRDVGVGDG